MKNSPPENLPTVNCIPPPPIPPSSTNYRLESCVQRTSSFPYLRSVPNEEKGNIKKLKDKKRNKKQFTWLVGASFFIKFREINKSVD